MRTLRAFAALALSLAAFTIGVSGASATDPFPITRHLTLSNLNFTVHYNGDDGDATCQNFITEEQAGTILGMLDRARNFYLNMKDSNNQPLWTTAPFPDTDLRIHVSIDDFAADCLERPAAVPLPAERWDAFVQPIAPNTDDIHLDAHKGLTYPVIAHEVFHLFEDAMAPGADLWLKEGTAEWAAVRANKAESGEGVNPDRTIDCVGAQCGDTEFDKNGYPGWMLFEYLAERFHDDGKVRDVWLQAQTVPVGTTDLDNVLQPLGTSLPAFFNDYATARMTGAFTLLPLAGSRPAVYAEIPVGTSTGSLPDTPVAVNHLAVRYVTLLHGSDPTVPCFAATLSLTVDIPPGVTSTPVYYANTKTAVAQPLTVSGSTATIGNLDWNTCSGSPDAYLSLPNDTLGADGREFTVHGSVTVTNTPASPTDPPPGVHVIGTPISAPTSDPAPTLKIYAPEVIKVSSTTRLLRFVVFSSGDGKLGAMLGSTGLGSAALRSGNNDIRFVLPTQLFQKLSKKSTSNVLQLTSESPSGAKGATFTRHVVVQKPPKKKPKRKKH